MLSTQLQGDIRKGCLAKRSNIGYIDYTDYTDYLDYIDRRTYYKVSQAELSQGYALLALSVYIDLINYQQYKTS